MSDTQETVREILGLPRTAERELALRWFDVAHRCQRGIAIAQRIIDREQERGAGEPEPAPEPDESPDRTCSQQGCAELATWSYIWPGRAVRDLACDPHYAKAKSVAEALGCCLADPQRV